MINVATNRWYDLVLAMMKAHDDVFDHAAFTARRILWKHYQARYEFVKPHGRDVYLIEFLDPQKETLFRLRYSQHL